MILRLLSIFFFCLLISPAIAEEGCEEQGCHISPPETIHQLQAPSVAPVVQPKAPPLAIKASGEKQGENNTEPVKQVSPVHMSPQIAQQKGINKKIIHVEGEITNLIGGDNRDSQIDKADKTKLFDATVSVLPENTTMLYLSNLDVNRIVCPVEMGDDSIIYSKEKRIAVEIRGQNAFVKFLILKSEDKETKVTNPAEFHVLCGNEVFSIIAYPQAIPAQTVKLALKRKKHEAPESNLSALPYEEKLLKIIQDVFFNRIQNYSVTSLNHTVSGFKEMDLILRNIIKVDAENLIVKEYLVKLKTSAGAETMQIKEKDFIRSEIVHQPIAIMLDRFELKKNEFSRLIIVENDRDASHE